MPTSTTASRASVVHSSFGRAQHHRRRSDEQTQRSFGSVIGDLFSNDFPTWTASSPFAIHRDSSQEANLARATAPITSRRRRSSASSRCR